MLLTLSLDQSDGSFKSLLLDLSVLIMLDVVYEVCQNLLKVNRLKQVGRLRDDLAACDPIRALVCHQAAGHFEVFRCVFVGRGNTQLLDHLPLAMVELAKVIKNLRHMRELELFHSSGD